MGEWQKYQLGECLTQKKRKVFIKPDIQYSLVTISNKGEVKLREKKLGANINAKDGFIAKAGDFIYSRLAVHTGAFGLIPAELDGALVTGEMPCFKIDNSKILPIILIKILNLPSTIWQLNQFTQGVGRVRVKEKTLLSLSINLPDIKEQEKILSRFLKIENQDKELKTQLNYQQTLIKKLRQQILQEAIEGELTAQWRKLNKGVEPASQLLEKIRAEKAKLIKAGKLKKQKPLPPIDANETPFPLPPGWAWCRLGDVIFYTENLDIQKKLSPETKINYVDIDCIDNSNQLIREIKVRQVSQLSTRARRVLKQGFIIYSTVRPYLKNIAIINDELPLMIGSTGFNVFKPILIDKKFIFYFLLTPNLNKSYEEKMIGFNSPSITNEQFEKTLLPLPPLEEQKAIVAKVEKLLSTCEQLQNQTKQNQESSNALMQSILHEAFTPT